MYNPLRKLRGVEAEPIGTKERVPVSGGERSAEVLPPREHPETKQHTPETEQRIGTPVASVTASAENQPSDIPQGIPIIPLGLIEKILEQDMQEIYFQLPPDVKPVFKARAEEAARSIQQILQKAKSTLSQIREVIIKWLQVIPGVNQFFIEQEAKLKAEKIFRLRKDKP
ncbi:MAG: hypothetical protein COT39_04030 [Parcubacteria group bacterium CG08_land_8_20_14_0_20_48_21]|nr:MAG: hypothetical protein AUK21_00615 [Parcubacteria group bacterium CG2_30_48_51]PIS32527.1 MAG: hypothetical protein COT39_04030 [Parcubacteria group bacterium CG08_land_8_20_14_0_20_48_21]PIW79478.1 MAG: hypothetical protein COZ99_00790 [Parcubacteria group bacterium CG_4_8_14_3_um_filter_48_16]PIY77909.1 MAG: hypothetical protein COY83_02545 [Parcubacteria group bacterium CG_4_10_14_0_8_um_filter_48_154]PIZ77786.1 MAG: hypothetical protein COY03_01660 [bacterium CG_4_10_14_0_2_um_filter_